MSELCDVEGVNHPFDKEIEASLSHLYRSFCNHVTLGQWELARVCLKQLYTSRQLLKKPLKDVLRAVIDRPNLVSSCSPTVISPLHLSWLCLVDYLVLYTNKEDKLPIPISLTVQFHLLLYLNNWKTAPKHVIQELDDFYSKLVYKDTSSYKDATEALSTNALQFLSSLLDENPEFAHAFISQLISYAKHFLETNQSLQKIYVNSINRSLHVLTNENNLISSGSAPSLDSSMIDSTKKHLYRMLSLLSPTPDMLSLSSPLQTLFENLCQQSKVSGLTTLDIGSLYSCLLQRPTGLLIKKFCQVENRLRFPREETENGEITSGGRFSTYSVHVGLSKFDAKKSMKCRFVYALDGNHVLENIVKTSLLFIKEGDFSSVTQLLMEFSVLKPLVLLLGWSYCYSCENAKQLLDTLWDQKAQIHHPLLYQACEKLAYQVQLVQWCLQKAGLLLASNEAGSTNHQQASEMFQGLESYSVLRVLHKSISLAQLPEKEVFALLRKRPVFSPESDNERCREKQSSDSATETRTTSDTTFTPHEEHLNPPDDLHPDVERDLILYHSFCAMKNFMDCIINPVDSSNTQEGSSLLDKLLTGRKHLTMVFPLTYRIEILENIFSLIFTMYEDLYSENPHHESDDLDTADDEIKSLNTSLTGSLESLASIASTDVTSTESSPFKELEQQSTPESSHKMKGHSRAGSHGSRKQLFQLLKTVQSVTVSEVKTAKVLLGEEVQSSTPAKRLNPAHSRCRPKYDSECSKPNMGFIMNNEVVPEYLKILKECLVDLNAQKLEERHSEKSPIYNDRDWIYTSVGASILEQRISRLSQFIVEAQWRYQLVSWTADITGERPSNGGLKSRQKQTESIPTEKVKPRRTTLQSETKHHGSNGEELSKNDEISDESSSYLSQEVTTGTEDSAANLKFSKKHSKVTRNGRRGSVTEKIVVRDDSTVARMLSSPETLIFMCLRKNSYDRAQQVIKMFQMHGKPSAKTAIFAEKFSNSYKELSSLQPRTRQALSSQKSTKKLGAVALAAASGVSSTVTSSLIDHLLSLSIASPMVLYNFDPTDEEIKKSVFYGHVHPELLPSMVCIDMACTANVSQDVCKNLLDTAKSRLPKAMDATVKSENGLVGVSNILSDLYQLLQPNEGDKSCASQPNLVDVLSGRESLQVKHRSLSRKHENEQQQSIKRMARALDVWDATIIAVQEAASKASSLERSPQELQASFSLVEKSLSVRVGLTELQKSYSCTVDHATGGVFTKRERFDYLRSLLNHVDTLATLLLHWHSKPDDFSAFSKESSKSVSMKASNPFVVLNKGIAETFGKPMFEKNVSPKRLEAICKQLNINLVKVIVHNCCQHIPSNGLTLSGYAWPSSHPMVLNDGTHWLENAREPTVVAKELLSKMVELLTDAAKNNNGLVDATCASFVVCSPQFSSIVQATSELQRVNLDLLHTNEDKMCFFINVLNLLIAHASLLKFSTADNEQHYKPVSHHGSLSNLLGSSSSLSCCESRQSSISSVDRISFLKHHCYAIGQMGPTSAFDLLFVIIRSGMFPPTMFGSAIQLCYPERYRDDPKRKYKPNHHDKRVVFAVSDGCLSSPDLQVYDADHLEVQLNAAAMAYVNRNVTINANQVVLPELLKWYRNDFTNEPITDLESSLDRTSQGTNANFLLLLEPYLNSKKAEMLQSVLSNIKEVSYSPFCWTFGYQFDVSSLDHSESSSSLHRSSSVPDSLHLSLELSGASSMSIIESRGKFNPSLSALEYISKASPLVSTLVELVCSKHSDTAGQGRSVVSNDMCFISLLKKMTGYPTLQRCIASRVYCIAEFLTTTSEGIDFSGSYEVVKPESKYIAEDDILPKIKCIPLLLSANDSIELQQAYQKASDFFLRQGNFYNLLELIRTTNLHSNGGCGDTVDYLLASAVLSKAGSSGMSAKRLDAALSDLNLPPVGFTHKWIKKPQTLLAQIKDNDQLAQLVLSNIKVLKAKAGLDLLNLAISRPSKNTALRKELQHRRQELSLHNKIARCAKAPHLRDIDAPDSSQSPSLLTQIPSVASLTIDNPSEIMEFLLSIQQYELASNWADLHGLPSEYHKIIKEKHLKCLLDSSPEDTMKAYCILEGIQEQHMALEICQSLLHQKLHVSQVLFIIQFMLTNLQPHLSPLRIEELLLTKMGAKALLCIPEMARSSYEHLVSRPYLLLEQLLMNLKVEWAAQVFSRLQVDLALMKDNLTEGGSHSCTVDAFDALLANYSAKALEFQVVQTQHSPEDSLRSTDLLPAPSVPFTSSYASHSPTPGIDIPHKDLSSNSSQSVSSLKRTQTLYIPPAIPPSKEEWVPDAQALECVICREPFSMFNRRHHCRRCGRVVCSTCSRHTSVVPGYGNTAVRVCDSCYNRFEEGSVSADKTGIQPSPIQTEASSLTKKVGQEKLAEVYGSSPYSIEVKAESEVSNKWRLSLDPEMNCALRDEFYFEQAPSSSLCVAILDLHSDNIICGRLLLDLCNTLSKKLVPITPGVRNDEVDHNLIISMIRHLLFNAKLKMTKAGETGGLELCDTYLSHVELMKFLVESNCGDIPSLQDLTRPDSARRLRDRFIEDERLTLAMEVSTKCGLEPSSVWAASGFACLQAGDLATAREKFAMCMKSSDGKLQQQQHSQYLDKIVDMLQTSPLISYSQSTDDILTPLRGLADHCKSSTANGILDSKRFDECLYYLHSYGNDTSVATFYARHGHLRLACRYILEKKCHPDVFVESLLMRLISKENLSALKEQMEAADPSLQSWMPYLTASCRFLNKRGYHHLLYDFQLFMKDFFRAAQTCIRFFEGPPGGVSSQNDMFSRLDYLSKARSHIEAVIIEKKSPRSTTLSASSWLRSHSNLRRRASSEEIHHVSMTLSELTSYVNTINLQIEVTKFLHKCYTERGNSAGLRVNNDEKLPNLFGSGRIKADLAIQILLSGNTVQDGFSLTARIIQDYNLPAGRVYVDAGRALARQYKFNHIQQLLNCVADVGLMSDKCYDDIILACVRIVSADQNQAKNVENLIKLLKSDSNKIDAFLLCGKLRSAYLIAVKEKNLEAVQMIAEEAQKTGQNKTLSLCKKWLQLNQGST